MAEESIDDLKKLPAKDRIEKLREFEKKRKKELEEATRLLKESIEEARRAKVVESVEVPENKRVDITDLFDKGGESLEAVIGRQAPAEADETTARYELKLDYQILTKLDTSLELDGSLDRYKLQKAIMKVEERVNDIASKMDYSIMGRDVADQLVATRSVLYSMKKRAGL
jgi:hypothetical protein